MKLVDVSLTARRKHESLAAHRKRERRYIPPVTFALAILCSFSAQAHDFWLQPAQYWSQVGASIPFTLQVGHGEERQRSQIRANRIAQITALGPDGRAIDLRPNLDLHGPTDDGRAHFETPGTYIVVLETDSGGRSALSAQRFNEYARTQGLIRAIEERERAGRMTVPASERYRRVTKAVVQIGPINGRSQSHVTAPIGLPLEIIPERNPYAEPHTNDLPVRVIFEGQPLAGALIKLTQLEHDGEPRDVQRTDTSGRATFQLPAGGTWLLNVIWTKPAAASDEVDFETTFSSLSFGFPLTPAADARQP